MKRFVVLVLLLQCACVLSERRFPTGIDRGANAVSGGVDGVVSSMGFIVKPTSENWPRRDSNSNLKANSSSACEESYGFLPCTESALGNLFLLVVYGYIMFVAVSLLSDGSELLLVVMGPGIIGGLFLPVLGAFPDALLILG